MATRKQRKRMEKGRRHEYETVWVDGEGNELEEPPDDAQDRAPRDTKSPEKGAKQSSSRATRTPLPPSWQRAAKRAVLLGIVIFVLFALLNSKHGSYLSALLLAVMYTALFIPFTYYVDRFAYRRWQRRMGEEPPKQPRKR